MGAEPRPYSPEYGAAPFPNGTRAHRCTAGPLARGMRRSHRAIRSFRSITVLRKRSERRVFRRGSPGASLPSFAALRKKVAPAGAKEPSSCPRPRHSGQSSGLLRIRRLSLRFVSLSRRLRRADFFAAKEIAKETAKGNLSRRRFPLESFPIGQGAAAPLRSPGVYGGRETKNVRRRTGGTDCHTRCAGAQ